MGNKGSFKSGKLHPQYTHGKTYHPLYKVWKNMKDRVNDKKHVSYPYYGGRGISICEEWGSCVAFITWGEANGFIKGLQIDRIDNDGDYEPLNCRFITCAENIRNSTNTKLNWELIAEIRDLAKKGNKQKKIAEDFNISRPRVTNIINNNAWHDRLYIPPKKKNSLSDNDIKGIFYLNLQGWDYKKLAKFYKISNSVIHITLGGRSKKSAKIKELFERAYAREILIKRLKVLRDKSPEQIRILLFHLELGNLDGAKLFLKNRVPHDDNADLILSVFDSTPHWQLTDLERKPFHYTIERGFKLKEKSNG